MISHYRASVYDCGPETVASLEDAGTVIAETSPLLIPPRHTRRIDLELPIKLSTDLTHCTGKYIIEKTTIFI